MAREFHISDDIAASEVVQRMNEAELCFLCLKVHGVCMVCVGLRSVVLPAAADLSVTVFIMVCHACVVVQHGITGRCAALSSRVLHAVQTAECAGAAADAKHPNRLGEGGRHMCMA